MNLNIAIAKLQKELDYGEGSHERELEDALKLLIESGERIQVGRNNPGTHWNDPLPGETEK